MKDWARDQLHISHFTLCSGGAGGVLALSFQIHCVLLYVCFLCCTFSSLSQGCFTAAGCINQEWNTLPWLPGLAWVIWGWGKNVVYSIPLENRKSPRLHFKESMKKHKGVHVNGDFSSKWIIIFRLVWFKMSYKQPLAFCPECFWLD